jgi:endonuclease YncB( thermonuclease family)
MKKLMTIFLGLLLPMTVMAVSAEVAYVVDGDTFAAQVLLQDDIKISVRVRLMNVDTPEINGECESEIKMAYLAKERLSRLIPVGSTVELTKIKDDKYLGRIDAHVFDKDGLDVGEVLIKENLGRRYGGQKRQSWCTAAEIAEKSKPAAPVKKEPRQEA